LAAGDGTPDQQRRLGRAPVLPGSVVVTGVAGATAREWQEIDDILVAGPEIPLHDAPSARLGPTDVFTLDAEAAVISFGDGLTGRRPTAGEALYASYAWSHGAAGNVGAGALKAGPVLMAGISATNPLPMAGGADAERIEAAEKHIPRVIQHRERLVTAADFRSIAWRTPGVAVGRIDVLPAAHPDIAPVAIGTAPGAVTVLAIPAFDPATPATPRASREFLDALCRQLDPRRLVTTELVVRGPDYVGVWISVGIEIAGGYGAAEVAATVQARLTAFLSPLPPPETGLEPLLPPLFAPEPDPALAGWPLGRAVHARSLLAEVARTPGVVAVIDLKLARGSQTATESVALSGLELPEILGISVVAGDPLPLDLVRGAVPATISDQRRLPVPVVAETC
jgi:predicted phage baseplate assembly protein